jgi:hypothetical protein
MDSIQRETSHVYVNRVRQQEDKEHLVEGSDSVFKEFLNQALKLEAEKAAAGPLARLREVTWDAVNTVTTC